MKRRDASRLAAHNCKFRLSEASCSLCATQTELVASKTSEGTSRLGVSAQTSTASGQASPHRTLVESRSSPKRCLSGSHDGELPKHTTSISLHSLVGSCHHPSYSVRSTQRLRTRWERRGLWRLQESVLCSPPVAGGSPMSKLGHAAVRTQRPQYGPAHPAIDARSQDGLLMSSDNLTPYPCRRKVRRNPINPAKTRPATRCRSHFQRQR
ncbi:uncharacterized protein L969DRAFT_75943 [Mixia osmundae IAM 14324]|uniref:uncharacterized protein n=1 Tax=Mixia osmundae (strain CBS 9802 / IAM 14324 / JCM 22182 / KY 12970) TaxID=764103 RepID=UPI0004A54F21|nr:uncharacterized protein L969DRAFT_75943 [Mixia osmundae IAM 14324]KEI39047.1 hypothetical protein L969DRAFT_75943 [Mixia osmundae IAM 14324]